VFGTVKFQIEKSNILKFCKIFLNICHSHIKKEIGSVTAKNRLRGGGISGLLDYAPSIVALTAISLPLPIRKVFGLFIKP
jgi:hypothetical protein